MDETPNLKLPYIMAAQAQKHVVHNEALRVLDAIVQISVLDRDLATPPATPADGARYIVAATGTGAWAGHDGCVASFQDGAWSFYGPATGWIAWIADEATLSVWDGSTWSVASGGVADHGALTGLGDDDHLQYLTSARGDARYVALSPAVLGINTTADTTNRLAVSAAAILLNHAGAGHQAKINKAAAADTAALLFQTGFSGRAEMGTAGDDDFHFKVSADGATWHEAIVIARGSGAVSFPQTTLGAGVAVDDEGAQVLATAKRQVRAIRMALGGLISTRIKNEQLWKQAATPGAASMSEVLTDKFIEGLRERRNELDADYQQKLETFKPSYPTMVQISNKIAEIDRQIKNSVQAIKESLKSNYEASKSQEEQMKQQIETLRAEVLDLQKRSIQYNIIKREVDTNRSLYEGLLQRHKEVDVAAGVGANNVFIIDQAEVPQFPSSPSVPRALLLAFFIGLGAGLTTAYLLEQFDDTTISVEEIERVTGLPTLGVIPKLAGIGRAELELDDPRSGLAEAYRSLCTALQFSTDSGLPKTLLVTSSGPSEGKSVTSLAIARHFATMGLKVLLLDADLRNSSLHQKLGCPNDIGLSNYLTGACTPPEAFQAVPGVTNLAFMASGPLPPNAADLLGNARLHSLLSVGLEVFDLMVIDGPPVLGLADAALLSNATSATLFVVAAGQTRLSLARGALKRLQFGRGSLIGTVINKVDARSGAYGYGYGYGYGHKHGPDAAVLQRAATSPRLSARESG